MKKTYKLYNGKVFLNFDEAKHIYSVSDKENKVDDKIVYGITNILSVINKPALMYWAVNQATDYLAANLRAGEVLDEVRIKELLNEAKSAHRKTKDRSADIGTMIHDWLEKFLKAGLEKKKMPAMPVNHEMKNAINAFLQWTKENKVKFVSSERKLYSRKYGYAGTADAEAIVNGKLCVIDFKTSNAIYPEYFLQTTAYLQAIKEEDGDGVVHDKVYILRLSKENKDKGVPAFEVSESRDFEENLKAFLAAKDLYSWQMDNKKAEILKKANG